MSPCKETVVIDMDQEVTLSVRVSVGEKYRDSESLSQDLTAPLFVIRNVQVRDIAEKLCQRVLQIFIAKLREKELEEIRAEGVRRAKEIEDAGTKGDWTEEDDQDA